MNWQDEGYLLSKRKFREKGLAETNSRNGQDEEL